MCQVPGKIHTKNHSFFLCQVQWNLLLLPALHKDGAHQFLYGIDHLGAPFNNLSSKPFIPLERQPHPTTGKASLEVQNSLLQKNDHLVYAVCGAGKTELLFPPIFDALQKGQRVCIAAPRTDVILELTPRLRTVFPNTIIHSLYGDSPEETGFAQLVLATTHQLYRFKDAFDVMIVDEADAFPFSFDPALKRAVMKAKKKEAPVIYVSATPSDQLVKKVHTTSKIFQRFHGHPLPVPEFRSLWGYEKDFAKGRIPPKLMAWVDDKIAKEQPFLLFFPTIELIEQAVILFQKKHSSIEAVHSKDEDRKEKVMKLRQRQIPGVLTSTILERGITIANVQVAVVGADQLSSMPRH